MYDIIIIGAGFAGYTAAIYAARYNLKTLVIGAQFGGVITESSKVCNFPGYASISGLELMEKIKAQAEELGAEVVLDEVLKLSKKGNIFVAETRNGKEYESKALIIATGTKRSKLEAPGASKFDGRGVHYCATCDAAFYKEKAVAVIGGSNSAAHAALLLSKFASTVYVIYRKEPLRCEPALLDEIKANKNIILVYNTNISEVSGTKFVEKVKLDRAFNGSEELAVDGIFVEIGGVPSSAFAKEVGAEVNDKGEIVINDHCETNVPGVYAAGDVTNTVLRQGVVAAAQGAIAGTSAYRYISGKKDSVSW